MRWLVLSALLVTAVPAGAEDREPLEVEVGQTVSREVGYAMGYLCDDETILHAEMRNGTPDNNLFVVTGKKPGTTLCRAGTVENRPTVLFEVKVIEPPPAKPAKR